MSSFFNRRQAASRSGRSTPNFLSPNTSKSEQPPKTAVNNLYHLDGAHDTSPIISPVLSYSSHQPEKLMSPMSGSSSSSHHPQRSHTAPPATISFPSCPAMVSASTGPSSASVPQRSKRAPTPPPPYVEQSSPLQTEGDTSMTAATNCRPRSRTSSASSWIKRVVSRSSSRASLRKQYEQIPMSEEERLEAERVKNRKAQEALAEWNRINDALKAAGF